MEHRQILPHMLTHMMHTCIQVVGDLKAGSCVAGIYSRMLEQRTQTHLCVCNSPKYPEINLIPPCLNAHCSDTAPSSRQSPPRSACRGAGECHGQLFDLNLNFKTSPSLHFPLFKSIIHEIHKRARVLGCRASTWTALNLIHCFSFITSKYMSPCIVYKCLLRTL